MLRGWCSAKDRDCLSVVQDVADQRVAPRKVHRDALALLVMLLQDELREAADEVPQMRSAQLNEPPLARVG